MNIVCFGDSITHARNFGEGDRWPTILQAKLDQWKAGECKIYNRGIGGNTTSQGYDRIEPDMIAFLPGIVLVEFGYNDANVREWGGKSRVGLDEYAANLKEFYRIAEVNDSKCIFIINHTISKSRDETPQGNGKTYYQNFMPYNERLREVVEELKAPFIDLPTIMEERDVNLDEFLSEDGLHLSVEGNHCYADMVFGALKNIISE